MQKYVFYIKCKQHVFIKQSYANKMYQKLGCRFIKCELELSSQKERLKHENTFLLRVKENSAEKLIEVPLFEVGDIIQNVDSTLVSQSIYDFHINAKQQEFQKKKLI